MPRYISLPRPRQRFYWIALFCFLLSASVYHAPPVVSEPKKPDRFQNPIMNSLDHWLEDELHPDVHMIVFTVLKVFFEPINALKEVGGKVGIEASPGLSQHAAVSTVTQVAGFYDRVWIIVITVVGFVGIFVFVALRDVGRARRERLKNRRPPSKYHFGDEPPYDSSGA